MKHKNNYKSGLFVGIGIGILIITVTIGLYYANSSANYNSSKNNNEIFSNSTSTLCPMMRNGGSCGGGGCSGGSTRKTTSLISSNNIIDSNTNYETVNIGHDEYRLIPQTVTLKAGRNYKLVITPSADGGGCMNNMTIPGIDENIYDIKKGVPITIIINDAKVGSYDVICGNMGMYQGQIIVK